MKKKNLFAMAALASSMLFVACSNDELPANDGTVGNGEKSWVGLNITLPSNAISRAVVGDPSAEGFEANIKKVDIYLKNAFGAPTLLKSFESSDFNSVSGKWVANKAIEVPLEPGASATFFAAVNAPDAPSITPIGFINPDADPAKSFGAISSLLSDKTKGFTMFGTATGTTYEQEADAETVSNHTSLKAVRAVAKILVMGSEGGINPTTDFEDGVKSGKFVANTLKWTIGNDNKKIFLLKDVNGKDPNWGTLPAGIADATLDAEYANRVPTTYSMAVPAFSATIRTTGYDGATGYVQYCNENTNETYQYGNTTYLSLTADFVPNQIVKAAGVTGTVGDDNLKLAVSDNAGATATTFYYYPNEQKYFEQTAYEAAITAGLLANDFIGPYTNGRCYYYVPVRNSTEISDMGVHRNTYYIAKIKSLKAPGQPTPKDDEEEKPVVQKSWIAIDFEVTPWTPADMGDLDLE